MRNKKLLFIFIPVLIVVLVLIAGVVYLKLNSRPEKVFENSISMVFDLFKTTDEQYKTVKGNMSFTASVESDDESVQAINDILETASIGLNIEADIDNFVVKDNIKVTMENEDLINATILLQDEKGYIYFKDYLDKYIELPAEITEYSDLIEFIDKKETKGQKLLKDVMKEELIELISKQEFTQDRIEKRKISTLELSQEESILLCKEFVENIKQNSEFDNIFGENREEVKALFDDEIKELSDMEYDEDSSMIISIYTEGLLNKFAGFSIELKDGMDREVGMSLAIGDGKYVFTTFEEYNGEREEVLKVVVEDKKESKDKGTATITITADGEELVLLYNYETKGDQTSFVLSTEIEGVKFAISGNAVENGNNVKGNLVIAVQEETFGKANLNCAYDFTYDVEIPKVDTREGSVNRGIK